MAQCHGKQPANSLNPNATIYCGSALLRCNKCGTVGCETPGCPNRKFSGNSCTVCASQSRSVTG
jgi:hypothetical protein